MNLAFDIVNGNFATWICLVALGLVIFVNRHFDKKVSLLFLAYVIVVAVLDAANIIDYYISMTATVYNPLRTITSILGYCLPPASIMIVLFIMLRKSERKWLYLMLSLPLLIEFVLVATSSWSHWVFWFNQKNNYMSGPLSYLPLAVSGFYLALLIFFTVKKSHDIDLSEVITLSLIGVFSVTSAVLESIYSYKFLITAAMIVSGLIYYFSFFFRFYRRDALTGLFNRAIFLNDSTKFAKDPLLIVSCDLNGLKTLNDSKGHEEGDKALKEVARCLETPKFSKKRVYRTGGDEFIVFLPSASNKEGQFYIEEVRSLLLKTPYMASFGYALKSEDKNLENCIKESDKAMYKDKERYHHR